MECDVDAREVEVSSSVAGSGIEAANRAGTMDRRCPRSSPWSVVHRVVFLEQKGYRRDG